MIKDKEHFMKCETCGTDIDMRDLSQVVEHMHDGVVIDAEAAKKITAKKVGDSVEWTGGKPRHLN